MTNRLYFLILSIFIIGALSSPLPAPARIKPIQLDRNIREFTAERTCFANEVCKEEFQDIFKCRCPRWTVCRSIGKYYNAYCTMTATGYVWDQDA